MDLWIRQHGWFLIAGACIVVAMRADSTTLDTVDHHSFRQISSQPVVRTRQQLAHVAPTLTQQPQPTKQVSFHHQHHEPVAEVVSKTPVEQVASFEIDREAMDDQSHEVMPLAVEPQSSREMDAHSPIIRAASFAKTSPAKPETGAWLSGQIEVDNAGPEFQPATPAPHPMIIRARRN